MIHISKILVCSLFAIIIPFLYVILGLIVNLAFNGFNNIKLADVLITIKIVCAQLPIYIGFVGLMVLVGVVFKSNTATTVFSIFRNYHCQIDYLLHKACSVQNIFFTIHIYFPLTLFFQRL